MVKVVESDNEMVISDYYTDEFIAKKIFYNDQQQSSSQKEGQTENTEETDQKVPPAPKEPAQESTEGRAEEHSVNGDKESPNDKSQDSEAVPTTASQELERKDTPAVAESDSLQQQASNEDKWIDLFYNRKDHA